MYCLLTPIELDHDYLSLSVREVRLPGLQASNNYTGAPKQGRKVSDGAIVFEDGDWEQERVGLETRFSQDMEDLRRDKDGWLCRSTGVTLVFLVNIDEDYTSTPPEIRRFPSAIRQSYYPFQASEWDPI